VFVILYDRNSSAPLWLFSLLSPLCSLCLSMWLSHWTLFPNSSCDRINKNMCSAQFILSKSGLTEKQFLAWFRYKQSPCGLQSGSLPISYKYCVFFKIWIPVCNFIAWFCILALYIATIVPVHLSIMNIQNGLGLVKL
jgi:hypothetical protein